MLFRETYFASKSTSQKVNCLRSLKNSSVTNISIIILNLLLWKSRQYFFKTNHYTKKIQYNFSIFQQISEKYTKSSIISIKLVKDLPIFFEFGKFKKKSLNNFFPSGHLSLLCLPMGNLSQVNCSIAKLRPINCVEN